MKPSAAQVVSDPMGVVVELITRVEPGLEVAAVAGVVAAVAPGRNVRRRLAQALAERRDAVRRAFTGARG